MKICLCEIYFPGLLTQEVWKVQIRLMSVSLEAYRKWVPVAEVLGIML